MRAEGTYSLYISVVLELEKKSKTVGGVAGRRMVGALTDGCFQRV